MAVATSSLKSERRSSVSCGNGSPSEERMSAPQTGSWRFALLSWTQGWQSLIGSRTRRPPRATFSPGTGSPPGRLTAAGWIGRTGLMEIPEEIREFADVTIHVREPRSGFFEASFHPTSPETHLARSGFTIDTTRGLRAHSIDEALDWA